MYPKPDGTSYGGLQKVNLGVVADLLPHDGELYEVQLPADCPFRLAMRVDASGGVCAAWLS